MASKLKKTLGSVAQFGLPILGGMFGGPAGAAIGGAAGGALSGKTGALKQAGIGAAAGYGGAKLLGLGGSNTNSGSLGASLANSFGGGGSGNPLTSLLGGLFGGGGSGSGGGGAGGFNPLALGAQVGSGYNVGSGGAANQALAASALTQQSKKSGFGLGSLTSNPLLTGLGTMLGSQFIRSPKVPELPQSVIDFQNAARQGNPLQNQAAQALQQQLGQNMEQVSEEEIAAAVRELDRAKEQEVGSIQDIYRSLRPGSDYASDSSYKKDIGDVENRYAIRRADTVSQLRRQVSNDFNNQRAQQIAQASGLGQQQLQSLAQLSQFDLDRQLTQLGIQDRDKQVLRDYLLQFGGNLVNNQLDPAKALEMQLYQKLLSGGKI